MSEEINLATLEIMDAYGGFLGTRENIYLFHQGISLSSTVTV